VSIASVTCLHTLPVRKESQHDAGWRTLCASAGAIGARATGIQSGGRMDHRIRNRKRSRWFLSMAPEDIDNEPRDLRAFMLKQVVASLVARTGAL